MKLSTVKLLVPIIAVTIQSNSASTVIPPYLDHMRIPVALIGTLDFARADLRTHRLVCPSACSTAAATRRSLLSLAILAMGLTNYCYSFAASSLSFALVHCLNGFAYSAVTTLYMAFYVDSLAPDENRNHAIGYYVGCLAMGYSTGNFFGGLIADHWGYSWTFQLGALLSFSRCRARCGFCMVRAAMRQYRVKPKKIADLRSENRRARCSNPSWRP